MTIHHGAMLHDRATRGDQLTAIEQQLLDAWYSEHDQVERVILEQSFAATDTAALREQLDVAIHQRTLVTQSLHTAMRQTVYELLPDDEGWYGEIPTLSGVWANAPTLEVCRNDLQKVLEGWVVLGVRLGHSLPILDGIDLNTPLVAEPV